MHFNFFNFFNFSEKLLFPFQRQMETFSTFRLNHYFLFSVQMETIFPRKLSLPENFYIQSSFLRRVANSTSVFFLFLLNRTRHGGVGQRSGTRLETPLLGWALPLKILNHTSLDVDVPVFLHPGDITSSFHFFS